MYGLLLEALVDTIKAKFGTHVWDKIRERAKIDSSNFSTHKQYSETIIQRIAKHLADITGQPVDELMELIGVEFVNYVAQYGYDRILRVLGRHMRDFLNGLDNLHEYMKFSYPKLKPPSFFVEQETPNGLLLHYRTKRKGFVRYVMGQIKQVGKVFYKLDINITIEMEKQDMELLHVVYKLNFQNSHYEIAKSSLSAFEERIKSNSIIKKPIKGAVFFELFPFHIIFRRNMHIISLGESLRQAVKHAEGESIRDIFNLNKPYMDFTWDNVVGHTNNVFELVTIEPVKRIETEKEQLEKIHGSTGSLGDVEEYLKLKGQMMFIKELDAMVFLATPILDNLDLMFHTGFYINDLSMHDSTRDFVLVGTQQAAEMKLALEQEKHKSKQFEESMQRLDIESKRADELLYRMIPKNIADRLRTGEHVMNICEAFSSCSILLSDVVGFTSICTKLTPMEVVSLLNEMYTKFDKCSEMHKVYKVETIGDAYMVVSGAPERNSNHATDIIEMAFSMLEEISGLRNPATGKSMMIRIGCHTGSVVAGVVGLKMPRYCLFGDTVNTTNKMEATSVPMRIHITESTRNFIDTKAYLIEERGILEVPGKGETKTFLICGRMGKNGKPITMPYMELPSELIEKMNIPSPKWEGFKLLKPKK